MIGLETSSNHAAVARQMAGFRESQLPFATAVGLTRAGQAVRAAEQREMRDVFDKPTPYTLNSTFLRPATKRDLQATVWLKDVGGSTPADKFLGPQIRGGGRELRPFERQLRSAGILPAGMFVVPGQAATLDAYGNISRGQIVEILSYFRTFGAAGYSANTTDAKRSKLARGTKKKQGFGYFVGRAADGKAPLGVWKRIHFGLGTAIKPIMIFVDRARYQAIYDFPFVARYTFQRVWPQEFSAAMAQAISTARTPA